MLILKIVLKIEFKSANRLFCEYLTRNYKDGWKFNFNGNLVDKMVLKVDFRSLELIIYSIILT
jgi:hypothetical protein